ncbi:CCA tRNA nucleotidyltransferase [Candidatus Uabimicrobium sp. HlEnr_7]|uniref:CCA tRNA nucleotidyltransferase n=1 Tax=Candidatus Uabimicrobium helgolandensis TaxID=3095367 RepID=UPI003557DE47
MDEFLLATEIVSRLQKKFTAYLCGGCVRDQLLSRTPNDYDIVTSAQPNEIKEIFHVAIEVGMKFGIVCIKYKGKIFEIATFRKDGNYVDGRRPESIEFSDEKEDAKRRDFTINGLFFDPTSKKIIDYVGGEYDIRNKVIRTIGKPQNRFEEDHLRLLRAIRFATQLDFTLDKETWAAVVAMADSIKTVAKERIREEFFKMLMGKNPQQALILMKKSSILYILFPKLFCNDETFDKTVKILNQLRPFTEEALALSAFLSFSYIENKKQTIYICETLKLANKTQKRVLQTLASSEDCASLLDLNIASLKRFLRQSNISDILKIHYANCCINNLSKENYNFAQQSLQKYSDDLFPTKVINGNDLKEMGVPPGPLYKKILYDVEDQQLLGNIHSYKQATYYVRDKWLQRERIEIEKFEKEKF